MSASRLVVIHRTLSAAVGRGPIVSMTLSVVAGRQLAFIQLPPASLILLIFYGIDRSPALLLVTGLTLPAATLLLLLLPLLTTSTLLILHLELLNRLNLVLVWVCIRTEISGLPLIKPRPRLLPSDSPAADRSQVPHGRLFVDRGGAQSLTLFLRTTTSISTCSNYRPTAYKTYRATKAPAETRRATVDRRYHRHCRQSPPRGPPRASGRSARRAGPLSNCWDWAAYRTRKHMVCNR